MFHVLILIFAATSSCKCQGEDNQKDLIEEFRELDVDNDGYLTLDQLLAELGRESTYSALYFFDKDKDGRLSLDEWMELNDEQADAKIFDKFYDLDGDGFISREDIRRVDKNIIEIETDYTVKELFESADGNGNINKEQLKSFLELFIDDEDVDLTRVCDEVDANHDGKITSEEFRAFMIDYLTKQSERNIKILFDAAKKGTDGLISKQAIEFL